MTADRPARRRARPRRELAGGGASDPAPAPPRPAAAARPPESEAPATLAETTQLWWFCDGAIMDAGTRGHLCRAWGLCPRHSWLYFRAEIELKYQPLGVAILYEDLTGRAARLLASRRRTRTKLRALEVADTCLSCDYVAAAHHPNPSFAADRARVVAGARARAWVVAAQQFWLPRACPRCVPGPSSAGTEVSCCRAHLLSGEVTTLALSGTARYLGELQQRLHRCAKSMTVDGPDRSRDSDAALVEALGWFAGWPPALTGRSHS